MVDGVTLQKPSLRMNLQPTHKMNLSDRSLSADKGGYVISMEW